MQQKTVSIRVCGDVKYVGFRRIIWRNAKKQKLRGYVENIPSSNCVEIVVQGSRDSIQSFLDWIKSLQIFTIENYSIEEIEEEKIYRDFEIR